MKLETVFRKVHSYDYTTYGSRQEWDEWVEMRTSSREVELESNNILVECFKKEDTSAEKPIWISKTELKFPHNARSYS